MLAEVRWSAQLSHQTIHTLLSLLDQVCGQLHRRKGGVNLVKKDCSPRIDAWGGLKLHPAMHARVG